MAKQAEATLLLKIKTTGDKVIKSVGDRLSSLTAIAKKVAIGLAAIGGAATALAIKASKFKEVQAAFKNLAESQAKNSKTMLANLIKLSDGTVSNLALMKNANQALLLGLPVERFGDMVKIARASAKATGQSMEFMLQSIVLGIGRQSRLILDNLGIVIQAEKAYSKYAETVGKSVKDLTEIEKKQAFLNEALSIGLKNANKMTGSTLSLNDSWQQFKAQLENVSIELGRQLIPIIQVAIDLFQEWGRDLSSFEGQSFINEFLDGVQRGLINITAFLKKASIGVQTFQNLIRFNFEANEKLADEIVQINEEKEKRLDTLNERTAKRRVELQLDAGKQIAIKDLQIARELTIEKRALEEKSAKAIQAAKIAKAKETAAEELKIEEAKLKSFKDKLIKSQNAISQKLEEDDDKFREDQDKQNKADDKKLLDQKKKTMEQIAGFAETSLSGGFQAAASAGVAAMTDSFLPGFGGAASQAFNILSQEADEFEQTMEQLFSVDFVDNIFDNFVTLIDTVSERMPEIVESLIESIIENTPRIAAAMVKAFTDPSIIEGIILAIGNGVVNGIRDAMGGGEAIGEMKRGTSQAFKEGLLGGIQDGFVGAQRSLKSLTAGGVRDGMFAAFSRPENLKEKIKEIFNIPIPPWVRTLQKIADNLTNVSLSSPISGGSKRGSITGIKGSPINAGGFLGPSGVMRRYASGGIVDSIPALLTAGEAVIPKQAVADNRDLVKDLINNGAPSSNGGTMNISITVNGGFLGDENSARELAIAVDSELLKLRQGNESLSFDSAVV